MLPSAPPTGHDHTQGVKSLLRAGMEVAPTQVSVRSDFSHSPARGRLALTLWAWLGAAVLVLALAWRFGAPLDQIGNVSLIAVAPALVGFILLSRLGQTWARLYFLLAWVAAATMLAASMGGAVSPLALLFTVPLAYAATFGSTRLIVAAAVASAAGYVAAAWAGHGRGSSELNAAPEMLATAGLFLNALILLTRDDRRDGDAASLRIAETAHELRTPINHIVGFADMIEHRVFGDLDERYAEYAGLIRASGGQLLELINRRLDLSRIAAGRYALELEDVDVAELARDVAAQAHGSASAKLIEFDVELPSAPLRLRADPLALRQVLTNLIGNAVKFTPHGGRVGIAARQRHRDVLIEVSDTGPGIPAHLRARLGQRFDRGSVGPETEGAGLGLALSRALVRLHNGALIVSDAPAGGARIRVRLPIAGPRV